MSQKKEFKLEMIKKKYLLITCAIILTIYTGVSFFFLNHFYIGTTLNGVNISCMSIGEANAALTKEGELYSIELLGRNELKQTITSDEIELKYDTQDRVAEIKARQVPFAWISSLYANKNYELSNLIKFNKNKLDAIIVSTIFFNPENIVEPQNATFKYFNESYTVVPEDNGCMVDIDVFSSKLQDAVSKGKDSFNLESEMCYVEPSIKSDSNEIAALITDLNKYVSSNITYNVLDKTYVANGDNISSWISVNDNYEIDFNEHFVKSFVDQIASNFNTIGKTRDFNTSLGTIATVSGGDYGRYINTSTEVEQLIELIREGKTEQREPEFAQAAMANGGNDIGNTYVEINLTTQHMWFYSNGELITEGNVVTGNVSSNHITPPGVYKLKYKQRGAVLRGADYETPVNFWMPFNQDIGIHDATWRGSFGGSIYKNNGSHGCVNSPYSVAEAIFNNISPGTPIVCYY